MTEEVPLFWIKQINDYVEEVKEIPLWGFHPSFPLEEFSNRIAALLHVSEVKINLKNMQLRKPEEMMTGLGAHPIQLTIALTPLDEPVYWLMAQEDVRKLCLFALSQQNNVKGFSSPEFQEGFYRFLGLQVIETIEELSAFGDLSLKMSVNRSLPAEEALCLDVTLRIGKHTLSGRLICSHSFRHAFKTHFNFSSASLFESPLAHKIHVPLRAEVGQTTLPLSQWKKIKAGDFIVLDWCSYDPLTQKGTANLAIHSEPLLRARLKGENLKIIDYAFYNEEIMNENENDQFPDEEMSSESELEPIESENERTPLPSEEESPTEQLVSAQDIPLSLTVEVARFKINLEKLLQLRPGNILELPVRPEQGVDLTIGGKKIAKAELIKLGEVLGVKILQLADE